MEPLKTGDLLLMKGKSVYEQAICFLSGGEWSHCGMIIRSGDDLFVFECDIGQRKRDGVRVIPLCEKLKWYRGEDRVGIARLNHTLTETQKLRLSESIRSKLFKVISDPMMDYLFGVSSGVTYCSRLLCETYTEIGIPTRVPYTCAPSDLLLGPFSKVEYFDRTKDIPLLMRGLN